MKEPILMTCDVCGISYMSNERAKHQKAHDRFIDAQRKYPFIENYQNRESIKSECYFEIGKPFSDEQVGYAIKLIQTYFSRDYLNNPESCGSFDSYVANAINNPKERPYSDFNPELLNQLRSIYIK